MIDETIEIQEHEFDVHSDAGWTVLKAIPETQEDRNFLYSGVVIHDDTEDGWDEDQLTLFDDDL